MDRQVDLSIIIVNWRSVDFLRACVASIRRETPTLPYEIVVVDNASNDRCGQMLAENFPEVIFVQSTTNLGFSGANNLGVRHSHGSTLLFLNPDTEVLERAIEVLFTDFGKLANVGVVGARLLNSDRTLQTSCVQSFPTISNQLLGANLLRKAFPKSALWGGAAMFEAAATPVEADWVSGACMMIARSVFDRVEGFSSDYFMYAEDSDLCFKTRAAGYRNFFCGRARIVHFGGGSSQKATSNFANVMMQESIRRFFRKFRGPFYSAAYRLVLSGAALVRLALLAISFPIWLSRRGLSGWSSACSKWFAIWRWSIGLAPSWTKK
jgi:GT2 family glycosyltransferase